MTQDPSTPPTSSDAEEAWCNARAADVATYLQRTALPHGRLGEWPAWHVMPYASIWAIESKDRPEWIGWWILCGDLPTDGLPAQGIDTPRDAMRAFGKRWTAHADALDHGEVPPAWRHLADDALPKLTAQLRSRGAALTTWAADDNSWPATEPARPADETAAEPDTDD